MSKEERCVPMLWDEIQLGTVSDRKLCIAGDTDSYNFTKWLLRLCIDQWTKTLRFLFKNTDQILYEFFIRSIRIAHPYSKLVCSENNTGVTVQCVSHRVTSQVTLVLFWLSHTTMAPIASRFEISLVSEHTMCNCWIQLWHILLLFLFTRDSP